MAMVGRASTAYVTFEDYAAAELDAETKHEWLEGVVYAMGGGTVEHARLASKMISLLSAKLTERCTVLGSDAMIYVRETSLATYADVSVVCGPMDIQRVSRGGKILGEAVMNPVLIVEVLSPSTETYDRGEKFAHYMRPASLKEYLIVQQRERRIEVFRRPKARGHWDTDIALAGEAFTVLGEAFSVDDVYAA
jgi:Uma2 family endonuclease